MSRQYTSMINGKEADSNVKTYVWSKARKARKGINKRQDLNSFDNGKGVGDMTR